MARRTRRSGVDMATGLCVVRIEHQGPTGVLITVTRTQDLLRDPGQATTRRTVDVETAVDEVRRFLDEWVRVRWDVPPP